MKRKNEPRGESLGSPSTRSEDSTDADLSFISKDGGVVDHGPMPPSVKVAHRDAKRRRRTMEEVVEISSDDESMEVDDQKYVELKYRAILNDTMRLDKRIRELQREKAMSETLLHDLDVEMRVVARENKRKFEVFGMVPHPGHLALLHDLEKLKREVPTVQTAVSHRGKTIVLPDTLPEDVNELPRKFVERTRTKRVAAESSDDSTQLVYTQE